MHFDERTGNAETQAKTARRKFLAPLAQAFGLTAWRCI